MSKRNEWYMECEAEQLAAQSRKLCLWFKDSARAAEGNREKAVAENSLNGDAEFWLKESAAGWRLSNEHSWFAIFLEKIPRNQRMRLDIDDYRFFFPRSEDAAKPLSYRPPDNLRYSEMDAETRAEIAADRAARDRAALAQAAASSNT